MKFLNEEDELQIKEAIRQRKDEDAANLMYTRDVRPLRAFMKKRGIVCDGDFDDIITESLQAVLRRQQVLVAAGLEMYRSLNGAVMKTIHHKSINWHRQAASHAEVPLDEVDQHHAVVTELALEEREVVRAIQVAIADPQDQWRVFRHLICGMSVREVLEAEAREPAPTGRKPLGESGVRKRLLKAITAVLVYRGDRPDIPRKPRSRG
jgi:hypothetical protein